jgi:hypothetical protein
MKNSQIRSDQIYSNKMSFTAYSHSLRQKKHEPWKLNYQTFSDELTLLDMNFLSSP